MLDSANSNHPELVKLRTKLRGLEIEKRWAAEKLRPKLNLDYNFLAACRRTVGERITTDLSGELQNGLSF